ncbi:MAG: hypothetical protein A2091_04020 [Desulfuromonadales bacterium GWD2_61_12]|nr:MAG: hypothetical protein A2005_01565 [Desulfuromonadales bacterium GWC2_61_20]OGR34362.1 MAG: hypothetical protein A2091_04020 [Desulfuromonadales bacterium GWD2_61_12]HAD04005.1 riboflavin biosynthesis protein RibD [Desulfuromonas sp.]HBT83161.1 riboflavin biosynthesis protein RibD [Desulfuromonas sp.]
MRKVIVSNIVSVDGFIAGPQGEIDWFAWSEETADYCKKMLRSVETILFGRKTYELMAGYWPTATEEDPVIFAAMNDLPKVVFSRTLHTVTWRNARLAGSDLGAEINRLKQRSGKDLVIFGSGSLVAALTELGLIDDYRFFVTPVILGSGKTQFTPLNERCDLKLVESRTFETGVVLLRYERKLP